MKKQAWPEWSEGDGRWWDLEIKARRTLAKEEVRSHLQAPGQVRGGCRGSPRFCDCSLLWSNGVLEGRQKFLKAYPPPQAQTLQTIEVAM